MVTSELDSGGNISGAGGIDRIGNKVTLRTAITRLVAC